MVFTVWFRRAFVAGLFGSTIAGVAMFGESPL
jgi:hypothetical protein